jgi:phage baseplate assembly protein W
MDDRSFLGTGWAFPPAFDPASRAAVMVSQDEDIAQSLYILMSTAPGERVMHPTFGCGLKKMVFEQITESTITELKDLIRRAILFFEPRITLDEIQVRVDAPLEGEMRIHLMYTIRSTNTRTNLVYPLYLVEGSHTAAPRLYSAAA